MRYVVGNGPMVLPCLSAGDPQMDLFMTSSWLWTDLVSELPGVPGETQPGGSVPRGAALCSLCP